MASVEELKEKLKTKMSGGDTVASTAQSEPVKDRFVKGTLLDDKIIGFFQTIATIIFIVAAIGALWLFAENRLGVRTLAPWRIWSPSVFMVFMMFWTKPFLRLGWFGWAFVVVQSINLSGYFFQALQGVTGVR